jgi:TolB protein
MWRRNGGACRRSDFALLLAVVAVSLLVVGGAGGSNVGAGLIALDSSDGLYFANSNGTVARKLPDSHRGDENPRWSPDGRKIAFWSGKLNGGPTSEEEWVYTANADGTGRHRLAVGEYPVWSPDGKLIAFGSAAQGNWHVFVMRADGSDIRMVDTARFAIAFNPAFLPDGRLSFQAASDTPASDPNYRDEGIWVVNLDGTGLEPVKTISVHDTMGGWSPDGSTLAFTTQRNGKGEIAVASADGTMIKALTRNTVDDYDPLWTPDGHILFTSSRTGLPEVFIMNADGTQVKRITRFPTTLAEEGDWHPSASPSA